MTALISTPELLRVVHDEQLRQAGTARRIGQAQRSIERPAGTHSRTWARLTSRARLNSRPV